MSSIVYADGTEAQFVQALRRFVYGTIQAPDYLMGPATNWLTRYIGQGDADLAAALWRYTHTKSAPVYLKLAANRWMAPR